MAVTSCAEYKKIARSIDTVTYFKCSQYLGRTATMKSELNPSRLGVIEKDADGNYVPLTDDDIDDAEEKGDAYIASGKLPDIYSRKSDPMLWSDIYANLGNDSFSDNKENTSFNNLKTIWKGGCTLHRLKNVTVDNKGLMPKVRRREQILYETQLVTLYTRIDLELNAQDNRLDKDLADIPTTRHTMPTLPAKKSQINTNIFYDLANLIISYGSKLLTDFDVTLENINADDSINKLITGYNALIKECICYSDCGSYSVCFCYGNCNHY